MLQDIEGSGRTIRLNVIIHSVILRAEPAVDQNIGEVVQLPVLFRCKHLQELCQIGIFGIFLQVATDAKLVSWEKISPKRPISSRLPFIPLCRLPLKSPTL